MENIYLIFKDNMTHSLYEEILKNMQRDIKILIDNRPVYKSMIAFYF